MLEEALEHLVTGIVDHKDQVQVRQKELRRCVVARDKQRDCLETDLALTQ